MRIKLMLSLSSISAVMGCNSPPAFPALLLLHPHSNETPKDAAIQQVKESGTYTLMSITDLKSTPLATVSLSRGEGIGFQRDRDFKQVAVAGQEIIPLGDGTYGWVTTASQQYPADTQKWQTREALDAVKKIIDPTLACLMFVTFVAGAIKCGASGSFTPD